MLAVDLRTARLVLNQPLESDIDTITAYCQDPLFERYLTVPWPYVRAHAEGFVNDLVPSWWASDTEASWAVRIDENGPLIGVVSFRLLEHNVGFWMGADQRGFGYMPEAVSRVADWAFDESTAAVEHVKWECLAGNVSSAKVARKAGFRFLGTAPSTLPGRDESHPLSWRGSLEPGVRSIHPDWPAEVTA